MEKPNVIAYLLSTSARQFKRAVNECLAKYDLTTSQCAVIRMLYHEKELSQAEIATLLLADRATTGSVIQKLYEKGFVEKKVDSKDRRIFMISLTNRSREIAGKIEFESILVAQKALEGLSAQDIQILNKALSQIIDNLS